MPRRKRVAVNKSIYQMSVVTLLASVVWVAIGVYSALSNSAEVNVSEEILKPVNPNIDTEVLKGLMEREQLGEIVGDYLDARESESVILEEEVVEEDETEIVEEVEIEEASESGEIEQ